MCVSVCVWCVCVCVRVVCVCEARQQHFPLFSHKSAVKYKGLVVLGWRRLDWEFLRQQSSVIDPDHIAH